MSRRFKANISWVKEWGRLDDVQHGVRPNG